MNKLLIICEFYTVCKENFYTIQENQTLNIRKVIKLLLNYVLVKFIIYNISPPLRGRENIILSVVDKLVLIAPAIKLSDFLADFFCGVFSGKLSHSLEMNLSACVRHIEEEVLCK